MLSRRTHLQYEQLIKFERDCIMGVGEAGLSSRRIGRTMGRNDATWNDASSSEHRMAHHTLQRLWAVQAKKKQSKTCDSESTKNDTGEFTDHNSKARLFLRTPCKTAT